MRFVTLGDDFAIGRYEVTFERYERFARATGRPLPAEAEWEYAARVGGDGDYGPGEGGEPITADNLGAYAWYLANSGYRSREVGTRKPNAPGLYDMHGNVHEWCGPNGRLCGGAWNDPPAALRAAACSGANPLDRDINIGFRVVCLPYRPRD